MNHGSAVYPLTRREDLSLFVQAPKIPPPPGTAGRHGVAPSPPSCSLFFDEDKASGVTYPDSLNLVSRLIKVMNRILLYKYQSEVDYPSAASVPIFHTSKRPSTIV